MICTLGSSVYVTANIRVAEKTTALFAVRLCLREAAGTHLFSEKEVYSNICLIDNLSLSGSPAAFPAYAPG